MCEINHSINVAEKSAQFGQLMTEAREKTNMDLEALSEWAGISVDRLRTIEGGDAELTVVELQILSLALGFGLDRLFALDELSDDKVHSIFTSLTEGEDQVGLVAAAGAASESTAGQDPGTVQQDYERSVVQLHHCAECLSLFPRGKF